MIIIRFREKVGLNFECVLYRLYYYLCAFVYVCACVCVYVCVYVCVKLS